MDLFYRIYPSTQNYLVYNFSTLYFFSQLPIFILGILVYHTIKKFPCKDITLARILLFASAFLFIAFLTPQSFNDLLTKHFLYSISFSFFILSLHFYPSPFLVNKTTVFLGKISFSLYLVHFIVLDKLAFFIKISAGNFKFIAAFLLILFFSTIFSLITYYFIEIPGINFGKKLIKKLVSSIEI